MALALVNDVQHLSLSARRAWIEITRGGFQTGRTIVALRKESVDRNIALKRINSSALDVALRKESVDRNKNTPCHN